MGETGKDPSCNFNKWKRLEEDRFFLALVENINDAVMVMNADGTVRYRSPNARKLFDYSEDTLPDVIAWNLLHEEDEARGKRDFQAFMKMEDAKHSSEYRVRARDGKIKHVRVTARNLLHDEAVHGFLVTFSDATGQKERERAGQEILERFRIMIENISDVIAIIDADGTIQYRSPNVEKLFGYKPEELIGSKCWALVHPEDIALMRKEFQTLLRLDEDSMHSVQFRLKCKDGTYRNVELQAKNLLKHPLIQGVLINYRDITDIKRVEEALRRESRRYHALIESTYGMIWVVKPGDFSLMTYNTSFAKYFSERMHKRIQPGMKLSEYMPPDYVVMWESMLKKALWDGPYRIEYEASSKDLFLILAFYPLKVEGLVEGISIFGEDVTKQKEYKDKLEQSNQKLEKMVDQTIRVISKISEIRDPYTAGHQIRVQSLCGALARELQLDEETAKLLQMAAAIHDIGKVYIASDILNKPGKLNHLEYQLLQTHVDVGYEVISEAGMPDKIPTIVHQHHERLDGSGYPKGLRGEEILMESRILAVADVVEAMNSHRPYRPALSIQDALSEIVSNSGTKYDDKVVDACVRLFVLQGFTF